MCGPVFNAFMQKAVAKFGGREFRPPESCQFIKIDRNTGARLPDSASGGSVVAECFREGEEPIFGIQFDGGFAMGSNFELFSEAGSQAAKQVTNSSGGTAIVGPKASFGTLSSGGLY